VDAFTLLVKLKMDDSDMDSDLKKAESKAKGFGSKLASGIGNATKVTAKAIGVATVAGAAAVGKVVKESVAAFGDFQQLKGGIETLFGKDAPAMLNNASKAFANAGVSANQYMEMAIQSSAAMITSLGGDTKRASELMDQSIIDMSDNVNKMGTTMEAVQNAYMGFSRGNFTMLDNLALGYAGTKEGMKELLARANEINKAHGKMSDYAIDSYADIVEAIHVVQTEMGITGTTADEAGKTITGSAGSAKAAWEDLKVAMASGDDAKLTAGIDNLINSVTVFAQNIIPVVENALKGVGNMVEKIAPIIAERLPGLVDDLLPGLLSAAASLVQGVVNALPGLLQTLLNTLPNLIKQIVTTIRKVLPDILKAIVSGLKTFIPEMWKMGTELLTELANGMGDGSKMTDTVIELFNTLIQAVTDNLPQILMAGLTIIEKLAMGIVNNLDKIVDAILQAVTTLIQTIVSSLPQILQKGKDIVLKLVEGIVKNIPKIVEAIVQALADLVQTIVDGLPQILETGVQIILELAQGLIKAIPQLVARIPEIIVSIVGALLSPDSIGKILQAGLDMIGKLFEGLLNGDFLGLAWDLIKALAGAIAGVVGGIFKIGATIIGAIWDGMKSAWKAVDDWISGVVYGTINQVTGDASKMGSAAVGAAGIVQDRKSGYTKDDAVRTGNVMADRYRPTTVNVNVGDKRVGAVVTDSTRKYNKQRG